MNAPCVQPFPIPSRASLPASRARLCSAGAVAPWDRAACTELPAGTGTGLTAAQRAELPVPVASKRDRFRKRKAHEATDSYKSQKTVHTNSVKTIIKFNIAITSNQ